MEVILRRSARARRLSLRVSRLDGRVTLTLPQRVSQAEGQRFLDDRESWIRRQLAQVTPARCVDLGDSVPVLGAQLVLTQGLRRGVQQDGDRLLIGPGGRVGVRVQAWLKEQARARLVAASDHYSAALGRRYTSITLRDTRSRWGSCSAQGRLMYSWRLVMAPEHVLDYVAAHECAHLVEMNHSAAFWGVVARLRPDWRQSRDWLREQGAALHSLRFDD